MIAGGTNPEKYLLDGIVGLWEYGVMSPMAGEEKRYYQRGIGDREPFSASPKQAWLN